MSLAGKLATLFPLIHLVLILGTTVHFIRAPGILPLGAWLFVLYLLAPLLQRCLQFLFPLEEGTSDILQKGLNPWWLSHQIQMIYMAFPFLEAAIRMIPGCYSAWLRLWGSRLGKNIYWTPGVQVYDRGLLVIGDHVIIGERSSFVSHVITPKKDQGLLLIKKVVIEDRAFIGAGSVLSPGCLVKAGSFVRAGTEFYPHSVWGPEGLEQGKIHGR